MPMRLVRRSYKYVRVDALSSVMAPLAGTIALVAAGKLAIAASIVTAVYAAPFVVMAAFMSNRVCMRAGLLSALFGMMAHEFFFSAPYDQLNMPTAEQSIAYVSGFVVAWLVARRTTLPAQKSASVGSAIQFPFAASEGAAHERKFWLVAPSDNWSEDCDLGAEYARIYLDRLRSQSLCPPLGWIVRDMIAGGTFTGIEAGFLGAVTTAAAHQPFVNRHALLTDYDPDEVQGNGPIVKP